MTQIEIDALEQASRTTMVWSPEGPSINFGFGAVVMALAGLLAAAASLFAAL